MKKIKFTASATSNNDVVLITIVSEDFLRTMNEREYQDYREELKQQFRLLYPTVKGFISLIREDIN